MDSNHDTGFNRSQFVQSFCHRCKAVCGAGCSGDDVIVCCQGLMVYIVNDGRKVVTSRSGDNYFTSACIDVCLSFCFGGVESGALQNYVYAKLSPWAVVSIWESIDFDVFAIYCDGIFIGCYGISQSIFSLRRVIF